MPSVLEAPGGKLPASREQADTMTLSAKVAHGGRPLPLLTEPPANLRPQAEDFGIKVIGSPRAGAWWADDYQHTWTGNILHTIGFAIQGALIPLWPIFISLALRDWSFTRHYFRTMLYCLRSAFPSLKGRSSIARVFKYNILTRPETLRRQVAARQGACTRCAKCCKQLNCIFLGFDEKQSTTYCRIYNTRYWHLGTCGRYPIDQFDIDDHGCPGFAFSDPSIPDQAENAPSFAV